MPYMIGDEFKPLKLTKKRFLFVTLRLFKLMNSSFPFFFFSENMQVSSRCLYFVRTQLGIFVGNTELSRSVSARRSFRT